ncbi:MAG: hypothetical protein IJP16_08100, partial [Clostridia bacterium]|nr:hypothetical protein [Clostridia bacterium]
MLKANFRRIALTLAVLTVLVSVFCLTAMAANVSYDFASYGKTADVPKYDAATPENGGWEVVKPNGLTKGTYNLVFAESSTGFEDSATRFGTVHSDGKIIYHIPAEDQVNIKDFGGIVFNRRLSNGHTLADSYGAMIGILLTMDDGQTIYREYNWYKTNTNSDVNGKGKDETDVSIASAIEALEG